MKVTVWQVEDHRLKGPYVGNDSYWVTQDHGLLPSPAQEGLFRTDDNLCDCNSTDLFRYGCKCGGR